MAKGFKFVGAKKVGAKFKGAERKVSITMRIDPELLAAIKTSAKRKDVPYQSLINEVLKHAFDLSKVPGGADIEECFEKMEQTLKQLKALSTLPRDEDAA